MMEYSVDLDVLIPVIMLVGCLLVLSLVVFVFVLWRKLTFVLHELAGVAHRADKIGPRQAPATRTDTTDFHREAPARGASDSPARAALTTSESPHAGLSTRPDPPIEGGVGAKPPHRTASDEKDTMGINVEAWVNEVIK